MTISSLSLHNVRSYDLFSTELDPKITLILGNNGTGKTSLLEALYVMHRGTSFRGRDRDMIAHNSSAAEIKLVIGSDETRRARLQETDASTITKSFVIEDKTTSRLPAKHRLPVVLFEPDELRLLSSSPQRRRQFIDDILSHLEPSYSTILNRYSRTLLQRNELLKQHEHLDTAAWENHLFAWDIKFAELAKKIVEARQGFIDIANQHLGRLYSSMAGTEHDITIRYVCHLPADTYQQSLSRALESQRKADAHRGFTSFGPHRDDISILLNGYPAGETASRGEMRTIMLAFKLLEVELQQQAYNAPPLILMDDVFSELDIEREKWLMHALEPYQTVITATDLRDELKIKATTLTLESKTPS